MELIAQHSSVYLTSYILYIKDAVCKVDAASLGINGKGRKYHVVFMRC